MTGSIDPPHDQGSELLTHLTMLVHTLQAQEHFLITRQSTGIVDCSRQVEQLSAKVQMLINGEGGTEDLSPSIEPHDRRQKTAIREQAALCQEQYRRNQHHIGALSRYCSQFSQCLGTIGSARYQADGRSQKPFLVVPSVMPPESIDHGASGRGDPSGLQVQA